jgi:Xaa-Pro aminopeptidase
MATTATRTSRADRLVEAVGESDLDQLLVGDLVNPGDSSREAQADVFWLSGFTGTSALCLISADARLFLTDFRYVERAEREVGDALERAQVEGQLIADVAKRLRGRVGFDPSHTSVAALRKLEETAADGVELIAAERLVSQLRRRKDPDELRRIAEAAKLADEIYEWTLERGLVGRTEREVRLAGEQRMRELGAEDPSFPTIVAAGENAALPHHETSDREIGAGELVIIDMGALVDGYCSDCTRTFATGELDDERVAAYELVQAAQAAGLEAIAPGVAGRDADAVARERIDAGGLGEHFGHGLGHGVGIEIHEAPRLAKTSEDTLIEGDVVTVEPGVYLAGRFGIRIEDLVTVTADGFQNLSGVPKDLRYTG